MNAALLLAILIAEGAVLWLLQRRVVPHLAARRGALIMLAPPTIAHETAHLLMAIACGVPFGRAVGGRVRLFSPRRADDGSLILGSVDVARTDPLRGALIAVAPVLLVPAIFALLSWVLIGTADPASFWNALHAAALWQVIVWALLALTLPLAAFPSPGDHIGGIGGIALVAFAGLLATVIVATTGTSGLTDALGALCLLLALPAMVAALITAGHALGMRR